MISAKQARSSQGAIFIYHLQIYDNPCRYALTYHISYFLLLFSHFLKYLILIWPLIGCGFRETQFFFMIFFRKKLELCSEIHFRFVRFQISVECRSTKNDMRSSKCIKLPKIEHYHFHQPCTPPLLRLRFRSATFYGLPSSAIIHLLPKREVCKIWAANKATGRCYPSF